MPVSILARVDLRITDQVGARTNHTVHDLWAGHVLEMAAESGARPFFRTDNRTKIRRNDIFGFIRRCGTDGPPKFTIQRLRITWLVGHLNAGSHLLALEQAAGVAVGQPAKYAAFADPLDEAEARVL